ncbi:helix-turn-helix domain-containing protein [Azohydromonas australica]|uniref:helix-turn-helix domain-containing protein n=1 Tax=Azohydromonas australica TaxID=364039 RepID=UPI000407ED6D|nr:helix-turn-helix domain-containing protein [Azohydromonas australica]
MDEHSFASRRHHHRGGTDVVGTKEAAELLHVSVATVQKMVERGDLKAWRTEGGHRRIPVHSILKLTRSRTRVASPAGRPLSTLLVEPNVSTARALGRFLRDWGSAVKLISVDNATDALASIACAMPDLLITDLVMQPLDGFELIRAVRRNAGMARLRILVTTALPEEEIQARGGLDNRTLRYRKPVPFQRLAGFIDAQLMALGEPGGGYGG